MLVTSSTKPKITNWLFYVIKNMTLLVLIAGVSNLNCS